MREHDSRAVGVLMERHKPVKGPSDDQKTGLASPPVFGVRILDESELKHARLIFQDFQ